MKRKPGPLPGTDCHYKSPYRLWFSKPATSPLQRTWDTPMPLPPQKTTPYRQGLVQDFGSRARGAVCRPSLWAGKEVCHLARGKGLQAPLTGVGKQPPAPVPLLPWPKPCQPTPLRTIIALFCLEGREKRGENHWAITLATRSLLEVCAGTATMLLVAGRPPLSLLGEAGPGCRDTHPAPRGVTEHGGGREDRRKSR